jgi:hypothetical protein
MSSADWRRNRCVIEHQTGAGEIRELFAVVERDLADRATEHAERWLDSRP